MFRRLKAVYNTLLMLDDTPHRIALGMALGLFIAWTPTVGIQSLIVIPVTWLLSANRVAGLSGIYLSNPVTIVPMYWLEYRVGANVLHERLTLEEFRWMVNVNGWSDWWQTLTSVGTELVVPMCIGGLFLGAVHALAGYYLTHWLVRRVRRSDRAAPKSYSVGGMILHSPRPATYSPAVASREFTSMD